VPLGFHSCSPEDLSLFPEDSNLSASGVQDIWKHLQCLDDPKSLEFQGGLDKRLEKSLSIQVLSCSYKNANCVTDKALIDDFFKELTFVTVFTDGKYLAESSGSNSVTTAERVGVRRHKINIAVPQTDIFNIKMNTVRV